jgi:hypothetical protein
MIDRNALPRSALLALQFVASKLIEKTGDENATIEAIKASGSPLYSDLHIGMIFARKAAEKIARGSMREIADYNLRLIPGESLSHVRRRLTAVLDAAIALELDDHFVDPVEAESFETAQLDLDEKSQIRDLLAEARNLTNQSMKIEDQHKRRILHRISRVEDELYKEKAGFSAFLAAAYETSRLVRQVGEDAQPIANAIEKARTITEKKIVGHQQIESEPKPKQLPKP